jgi:4-amino-4-deoxy-L-arabinose transferase-like glycosyltransferase
VSLLTLSALLAVAGAVTAWNLQGWPGRVNDDEGTYVAEAWAMLYPHHLSHYTYWYDHPPFGWAQIAAYVALTDGFGRDASAVMAGREYMWLVTVVSCALLFVLCRRLEMRRWAAAVAVLLFGLSPLAVYYHRMVSLDNMATMWLLAALTAAASRRRSLGAALVAAVCAAGAVLSKETVALLLPAVVWVLWQHTGRDTRRWNLGVFTVTFTLLVAAYPLMAVLRGELLPGQGHVSLGWALWWQFSGRSGSGSVLDTNSGSYGLAHFWLSLDPWLLTAGVALLPFGLAIRRLRPFAAGLLIQLAVLVKGGYLPYFYVTALLPFAALLAAGVADSLWGPVRMRARGRHAARWIPLRWTLVRRAAVVVAGLAFAAMVVPAWGHALRQQAAVRGDTSELAATAWIERHVPRRDVVVVDDYMWPDLKLRGWNPLWVWKVNTDPQVTREVLPHGYRSISYVVLAPQAGSTLDTLPTLRAALAHSVVVATFGDGITARAVIAPAR